MYRKTVLGLLLIINSTLIGDLQTIPPVSVINNNATTTYNVQVQCTGLEWLGGLVNNLAARLQDLNSTKIKAGLLDWSKEHKKLIVGTTTAAIYLLTMHKLTQAKLIFNNPNAWSNWKPDYTFSDLIKINTHLLNRELYNSILTKYNNNDKSDSITPIALFSTDLEQELRALSHFVRITYWLKKARVNKLFFVSDDDITQAHTKINLLIYLRKIMTESLQISLS